MDRLLLVLTLAVAPVLLFPLKFQFPLVAVTVPLLWLVRWPISGRLLPATPLNLPLAILGLSVLAGVFSTPDLYSSLNKIAGIVFGFLLFFALVEFLKNERRIRMAVVVFAGTGGLFALLSLTITRWKPFYDPDRKPGTSNVPSQVVDSGLSRRLQSEPDWRLSLSLLPGPDCDLDHKPAELRLWRPGAPQVLRSVLRRLRFGCCPRPSLESIEKRLDSACSSPSSSCPSR